MTSRKPQNATPLRWRWSSFEQLTVHELAAIYTARQQVFAVEQACAYLDADGYDEHAWHLAAWAGDRRVPAAYARVVHPGQKYPEPSIGRVITTGPARGTGLGRELLARALALCTQTYPGQGVRISAQSRLERFYQEAGFEIVGDRYLEDGIAHTEMVRAAAAG